MASYNKFLVILAILAVVVLPTITMAREYWVGDSSGWTLDYNYQNWAKDKVFQVGDSLVFNYTEGKHNVFKVDGAGFKGCVVPAGAGLTSGRDVIALTTPGKKWYICGVGKHCSDHNMKLVITVEDAGAPTPAPSSAFAISTSGFTLFAAAAAVVAAMIMA